MLNLRMQHICVDVEMRIGVYPFTIVQFFMNFKRKNQNNVQDMLQHYGYNSAHAWSIDFKHRKLCQIVIGIYFCCFFNYFHVCNWEFREMRWWSNLSRAFQKEYENIKFLLLAIAYPHKPFEKRSQILSFHPSNW